MNNTAPAAMSQQSILVLHLLVLANRHFNDLAYGKYYRKPSFLQRSLNVVHIALRKRFTSDQIMKAMESLRFYAVTDAGLVVAVKIANQIVTSGEWSEMALQAAMQKGMVTKCLK